MTVICDVCNTGNRENAMFCRGCTAKLPGFAATGPSVLAALQPSPEGMPGGGGNRRAAVVQRPVEAPRYWIFLSLLIVGMVVAFAGWYLYITRAQASAPRIQAAAPSMPPAATASALPLTLLTPVEPVEIVEPPQEPVPSRTVMPSASPTQAQPEPMSRSRRSQVHGATVVAQGAGAADPRRACGNLNFVAAARCEASQCDQAAFRRHPRCDVVRADRVRDEARRNPLLSN